MPDDKTYEQGHFRYRGSRSGVRVRLGKTRRIRHGKPARTHKPRVGRDPCPLERVASPQRFVSTGEDKTISLVWAREALFCTRYVHTDKMSSVFFLFPHEHTTHIYQVETDNGQRAQRFNAVPHKHQQTSPCVCDTPICTVLLWLLLIVAFFGTFGPQSLPVTTYNCCCCVGHTFEIRREIKPRLDSLAKQQRSFCLRCFGFLAPSTYQCNMWSNIGL